LFVFFYKLRRFCSHLIEENKGAPTTLKFYLSNIQMFIRHIQELRPKHCRLSQSQLVAMVRALEACKKSNQRNTPDDDKKKET